MNHSGKQTPRGMKRRDHKPKIPKSPLALGVLSTFIWPVAPKIWGLYRADLNFLWQYGHAPSFLPLLLPRPTARCFESSLAKMSLPFFCVCPRYGIQGPHPSQHHHIPTSLRKELSEWSSLWHVRATRPMHAHPPPPPLDQKPA